MKTYLDYVEDFTTLLKEQRSVESSIDYHTDVTQFCSPLFRVMVVEPTSDMYDPDFQAFGRIFIEREEVFDKWGSAPIKLPYPNDQQEYEKLERLFLWILTPEGLEFCSTSFAEVLDYDHDIFIEVASS